MSRVRYFSPEEIRAIADRLDGLANRGRIVRLLPPTALLSASALRMYAARPERSRIIEIICNRPCPLFPCYPCMGKANVILRLIEGDKDWIGEALKGG